MRLKWILLLLLSVAMTTLSAQNKLYQKFFEHKDVTSVYISKTMLKMMSSVDIKTNDVDISKIASKLDGIYILTTENPTIANEMKQDTKSIQNDKLYEPLMQVREDKSRVTFYIKKNSDKSELIKEMLILVDDAPQFVMIQLSGNMTLEDIASVTK